MMCRVVLRKVHHGSTQSNSKDNNEGKQRDLEFRELAVDLVALGGPTRIDVVWLGMHAGMVPLNCCTSMSQGSRFRRSMWQSSADNKKIPCIDAG